MASKNGHDKGARAPQQKEKTISPFFDLATFLTLPEDG